jgi:glycosyltransferase involved in cell wall biosynthesis
VRLIIVGGAASRHHSYEAECRTLADKLRVTQKVDWRGYLDDPTPAYVQSDAALMCSRQEGMGRVTAEAMAACRPVIGNDSGGTSELIEPEQTGLLYKDDPEDLTRCMARFVDDPAWAASLGEEAWRVARARYSIETYADRVYDVLRNVVSKEVGR